MLFTKTIQLMGVSSVNVRLSCNKHVDRQNSLSSCLGTKVTTTLYKPTTQGLISGWDDIGYNFLIGQDGRVYEARGWNREGAHTKHWNKVAIAFSIMGNFMTSLPNQAALDAVNNMIKCAVKLNKLTPDFKLYGHRDVGTTACPGDDLYRLIETWPHFAGNVTKPIPIPTPTP